MDLGFALKKIRKQQKPELTQYEFAKGIGITQSYLSQIEHSRKTPDTSVLERVANFVDVPLPILLWYSIEESDISPNKKEVYRLIKPIVDDLIKSIS